MQEPTTTTSKFPASPAILIESEEPENRKLNLLRREKTGETGNRVLVHVAAEIRWLFVFGLVFVQGLKPDFIDDFIVSLCVELFLWKWQRYNAFVWRYWTWGREARCCYRHWGSLYKVRRVLYWVHTKFYNLHPSFILAIDRSFYEFFGAIKPRW